MEPDDIPVHDLLGVGAEAASGPPGPDELRAIVARAGRRRLRFTSVGVAAALVAGGAVGYAVSNHSGSPAAQTTTAAPSGSSGAASPTAASGSGATYSSSSGTSSAAAVPYPLHYTPLFQRTAGGIDLRGFLTNLTEPTGAAMACGFGPPQFQVEVSTAKMVGTSGGPPAVVNRAQPVSAVVATVVGVAEGDPTTVVTVATGSSVHEVAMTFANSASDHMVPVKGWAALAGPATASQSYGKALGTLVARDAGGKVLSSTAVTLGGQSVRAAVPCGFGCPGGVTPQSVPRPAGGAASSGSGAVGAPIAACAVVPPLNGCPPLPGRSLGPPTTAKGSAVPPAPSGVPTSPNRATFACPLYSSAGGSGSGSAGASTGG